MSSFAISTASQRVALDASGAAQVAFAVTNTSGQTREAHASISPEGPASAEWLSLIGSPVRQLAPGGVQQVLVAVRVPAGSPPGSYAFRLDAVSAADPDDFTKGPTVSFEVPARKRRKRPPWRRWRRPDS